MSSNLQANILLFLIIQMKKEEITTITITVPKEFGIRYFCCCFNHPMKMQLRPSDVQTNRLFSFMVSMRTIWQLLIQINGKNIFKNKNKSIWWLMVDYFIIKCHWIADGWSRISFRFCDFNCSARMSNDLDKWNDVCDTVYGIQLQFALYSYVMRVIHASILTNRLHTCML